MIKKNTAGVCDFDAISSVVSIALLEHTCTRLAVRHQVPHLLRKVSVVPAVEDLGVLSFGLEFSLKLNN